MVLRNFQRAFTILLLVLLTNSADAQRRDMPEQFAERAFEAQSRNRGPDFFRTINGSNNNRRNPDWGAANTPLLRKLPAVYPGDGSGETILEAPDRANPRDISNTLFDQEGSIPTETRLTDFVWQWGQFLDHDISLTEFGSNFGTASIPVTNPDDDLAPVIPFTRSIFEEDTGTASNPRQQINQITSFIDASNIYGSSQEVADSLREFSGGLLKSSANGLLLPVDGNGDFLSGDVRVNEQVGLMVMHTLFMREHNRLATIISARRPDWDDEQVYQLARKIVGAEMQIITYEEFLPALLGFYAPSPNGGRRYNANVNPGISNVFSTALYRFGHTMLSPELLLVDEDGETVDTLSLISAFGNTGFLKDDPDQLEFLIRGLSTQKAQKIDAKIADEVREFLFAGIPGAGGMDLAARNIQRGRDHGLSDYNSYRAAFGLNKVSRFEQINSDETVQQALESLYGSIDNIDPWVGGLAEEHSGRLVSVGPLVRSAIREQFERLRDGDRFYWKRDPVLKTRLVRGVVDLSQLRLATVIRKNTEIENIRRDVFRIPDEDERGRDRNGNNRRRGPNNNPR